MATYYVDNLNGDNSNDGSSANPWETISHASSQAALNDTIIIRYGTGTYTHTPSSTFFSDAGNVTYTAELDEYGKQQVVLDGGFVSSGTTWTSLFRPYDCTIENFIFENYVTVNVDGGFIRCDVSAPPTFTNNIFRKIAIGTTSGGGYRGGFFSGFGNSSSPFAVHLTRNTFYDIGAIAGSSDACFFSTRNGNSSSISAVGNKFVYTSSPTHGSAGLAAAQIDPTANSGDFYFRNNILYSEYATDPEFISRFFEGQSGLDFQYNVLDGVVLPEQFGTGVVANNIETTVYFKNTGGGNFNLRPDLNTAILASGIQV